MAPTQPSTDSPLATTEPNFSMEWLAKYEQKYKARVSTTDTHLSIPQAIPFKYDPEREQDGIKAMSELECTTQQRRIKKISNENEELYRNDPSAYRLALELEIRDLKPITGSANSIALYHIKLNTLFDDAEYHGLEVDSMTQTETFIWAVGKLYPHFVYDTPEELTAVVQTRKPLPDVDEVHDDLQEYLIAGFDHRVNSDVYIGINAMCPTRKALIVGTEKLYKQAFEKRAVQREKKEHPFWDNDALVRMEKKRAAKTAKRTASESTAAPTTAQDPIAGTLVVTLSRHRRPVENSQRGYGHVSRRTGQ